MPIIKKVHQDTTIYWGIGSEGYHDSTKISKWLYPERMGKISYIKGLNDQGNITIVSLTPRSFVVKNDSLFYSRHTTHYELIFHPKMFLNGNSYPNKTSKDRLELKSIWNFNNKISRNA